MTGQFVIKTSDKSVTFISKTYESYDDMKDKVKSYILDAIEINGKGCVELDNVSGNECFLPAGMFLSPHYIEFNKGV